ncbi:MAG: corrinoid protein [Coriobacteriales bacterium]|jgi:5-methyltetrahydrofolate--homocysteine methyltransferase|nr:corrinoid protein [Coriobacteriales bacterium]
MSIFDDLSTAVQRGKVKDVEQLAQQAIDDGVKAEKILNDGLLAGMDIIGGKFKNNEIFVPEVLMAAKALAAGTALIKPLLVADGVKEIGTVVIGTVKGDLHDIGKNLVKMMLEGAGFVVIDLGIDVAPEKFVETAKERNADIIAMSAMLTTTMEQQGVVIEALKAAGLRDKVKVMIGGTPISLDFSRKIGADAYSTDSSSAVDVAKELVS